MRMIADGVVDREGVEGLAGRLGYSVRQVRRRLTEELGAGPVALARAQRAHTARVLLQTTALSVTEIAFAAGFASVRQFNDTIREVFARTPSELRAAAARRGHGRQHASPPAPATGVRLCLRLPFREPFDASGVLDFLSARAISEVEAVDGDYRRTLRLSHGPAVVRVAARPTHVECVVRLTDVRDLSGAVSRVRRLWDLNADPQAVFDCLSGDPVIGSWVHATPGIRVPGAVDGPELVLRAMLGQQVSVAAARTAAGRLTADLGEPVAIASDGDPSRLFPSPATVAEHADEVLTGPRRRIAAIREVAAALASGTLDVHVGREADELRHDLLSMPGIGPWTADYVLMRLLHRTDLLLDTDRALLRGAQVLGLSPARLADHARHWRPWRSYAGMYLWRASSAPQSKRPWKETP